MDTGQVEIMGRSILVRALTAAGVEVARPERDIGIDLISYLHVGESGFIAVPMQMKASSGCAYAIDRKYALMPGLLMVFVWNVQGDEPSDIYAMSYSECVAVAEEMGYTENASWIDKGRWRVTGNAGARLREALEPYLMAVEEWPSKVRDAWQAGQRQRQAEEKWLEQAAGSLEAEEQWQAFPAEAKYGGAEPDPVAIARLLEAKGMECTLVVRSHTEGLGPKSAFGRVGGLCDVLSRGDGGRLRPFPALEVLGPERRMVIPVNLVEDLLPGDQRDRLGLADAYDFETLGLELATDPAQYKAQFPHLP